MSREKLNAHKWEDILREMHEKPAPVLPAPATPVPCPDCLHVPCLSSCWRTHAPAGVDTRLPNQPSEKDEFAHRPFGSVNVYIRELERENATLRRRVRVLEELVSKS